MEEPACVCSAWYCEHPDGVCGKPISVKVQTSVAIGPSTFTKLKEVGICEVCYAKYKEAIPWVFSSES